MTRERPVYVLDTSVLLGDPRSLSAFPDSDVVLPLTVIEELDHKKPLLDGVGASARSVLRELETCRRDAGGRLDAATPFGDGATVRIKTNGLDRERVAAHGFDVSRPDNRILAACLGLEDEGGGPVTLVSNDAALRIKASQLGVEAVEHVPVFGQDGAGDGWRQLEVAAAVVDQLYDRGKLPVEADGAAADTLVCNEFAVLRAGSQSALVRRRNQELELVSDVEMRGIRAKNKEQQFALDLLADGDVPIVGLDGQAGTGKTLLALAAALEQTVVRNRFERIAIYRPLVSVERNSIGYLPGELDEKLAPWMEAITDTLAATEGSYASAKNLLSTLQGQNRLSLNAVTFLRGRSLHNTFVLVDEAQNLEATTLKTILTRIGNGSRVVFTGDTDQIDHGYLSKSNNALSVLRATFHGQEMFGHVTLTDCKRSAVAGAAATLL